MGVPQSGDPLLGWTDEIDGLIGDCRNLIVVLMGFNEVVESGDGIQGAFHMYIYKENYKALNLLLSQSYKAYSVSYHKVTRRQKQ